MQRDNNSQDLMLTIEQVSQLTGVRKSTLRYWEKSFEDFLRPARTQSNRREYTMDDLDIIKTIKHLLEEEHLTSEGVRLKLVKMFPQYVQREKPDEAQGGDSGRGEGRGHKPIPFHRPKN